MPKLPAGYRVHILNVQGGAVSLTVPANVPGTAVVLPPPTPASVTDEKQAYTLVAYVGRVVAGANPFRVPVPADYSKVFAIDLPDGVLAPAGFPDLFAAMTFAIESQTQPPDPGTTGND